jgi:hypothetical protein
MMPNLWVERRRPTERGTPGMGTTERSWASKTRGCRWMSPSSFSRERQNTANPVCSKQCTKPEAWRRPGSGSTSRRTAREEARGGARSTSDASSPLLNSAPSRKSTLRRIAAQGASSTGAELPRDGPEPPSRERDAAPARRDPGISVEVPALQGGGGCGLSAGARCLWWMDGGGGERRRSN